MKQSLQSNFAVASFAGMDQGPLKHQIIEAFDAMSAQLQQAARYVLDHPRDAALLSMREQARRAGVQPATMTRLAKHLGMSGYDEVRKHHAAALRNEGLGFAGRASAQVVSQRLKGDKALGSEMLASLSGQVAALVAAETLERIAAAAETLAGADRIYCLGLRSSFGPAWHFHYIMSLIGEATVLLDGAAGIGIDPLRNAGAKDALLAVSVSPYTRMTVDAARHAAQRGIPVVAITDSEVAPLAQIARHAVFVPIESPSFFHTMSPAFAVAEVLASLVAGHGGEAALEALRRTDEQAAAFDVHVRPRVTKGKR